MITPNDPTTGGPDDPRSTAALAATPYARRALLVFEMKLQEGAICALYRQRLERAEGAPREFFERARAIVGYFQQTQRALGAMPGREFFQDPAANFVSDLIFALDQQLKERIEKL